MELQGRRVHITGSAQPDSDEGKLNYIHSLVTELVTALASEGATFVVPFGKEPLLKDREDGPSIIFDWTVAEAILDALKADKARASGPNGHLIATLGTTKTDAQIPPSRRATYDALRARNAVHFEFMEPRWTAGASRRRRLAQFGDVLIGISGGEGVEHLALEYSSLGKPVIPLDIQVGASQRDGSGGAARLFERALTEPADFFRVLDGQSAGKLLDQTRTRNGETDPFSVVAALLELLHGLEPPRVFYVRLLNDSLPEHGSVESFFRNTVDPLVRELGYEPYQMGIVKNEFAWINQAIFDSIHHSSVVLVDLTALRPNCFMELGYALGNRQRVMITARDDTKISFDASSLDVCLWKESEPPSDSIDRLRKYWERNIYTPYLVHPREAK